jgi:DNA-binding GntR family transcriptional regulator
MGKIIQDSIADQVYEELKNQILNGELKAGETLAVEEISRDLSVSRTPVQAAIKRLGENGLLVISPRSKAVVPIITPKEASEIADIRIGIEQLALTKINHTLFLSAYEHLRLITNQAIEELEKNNDRAAAFQLDNAFHTELIQTTGNDTLVQVYRQLSFKAQLLRLAHHISNDELISYVRQHFELLQHIKEEDIKGAQKLLEIHINHQNSSLRQF